MSFTEINDIRETPEFKGLSFSNYKRSDVKKQLVNNLLNGKIEHSNYWCAELICSGNYSFREPILSLPNYWFFHEVLLIQNLDLLMV